MRGGILDTVQLGAPRQRSCEGTRAFNIQLLAAQAAAAPYSVGQLRRDDSDGGDRAGGEGRGRTRENEGERGRTRGTRDTW